MPRLEFRPADGLSYMGVDWSTVKSIDVITNLEEETEPEIRFFDSAEVSPSLWVRLILSDGDAIEGRVDNSLHGICSSCLVLYPLDEAANRKCVCVPRSSIAALQVVTLRQ